MEGEEVSITEVHWFGSFTCESEDRYLSKVVSPACHHCYAVFLSSVHKFQVQPVITSPFSDFSPCWPFTSWTRFCPWNLISTVYRRVLTRRTMKTSRLLLLWSNVSRKRRKKRNGPSRVSFNSLSMRRSTEALSRSCFLAAWFVSKSCFWHVYHFIVLFFSCSFPFGYFSLVIQTIYVRIR